MIADNFHGGVINVQMSVHEAERLVDTLTSLRRSGGPDVRYWSVDDLLRVLRRCKEQRDHVVPRCPRCEARLSIEVVHHCTKLYTPP